MLPTRSLDACYGLNVANNVTNILSQAAVVKTIQTGLETGLFTIDNFKDQSV